VHHKISESGKMVKLGKRITKRIVLESGCAIKGIDHATAVFLSQFLSFFCLSRLVGRAA